MKNYDAKDVDAYISSSDAVTRPKLEELRKIIKSTVPDAEEKISWGVPFFWYHGVLAGFAAHKKHASVWFPTVVLRSEDRKMLEEKGYTTGKKTIQVKFDQKAPATAIKRILRARAKLNEAERMPGKAEPQSARRPSRVAKGKTLKAKPVKLLAGGNPQIAKADGDAPVQAYIAAMPGWKHEIGRRLDALIVESVPSVRKAVKWNSPFYGIEGQGWFLNFHVFTRYVKVTFFSGTSLQPVPPGGKDKDARWIDIYEDDLDEEQMADWVRQAAAMPGWMP